MKDTFLISSGELAEFCFPSGSLGTLPSIERMNIGSKAHVKLQNIYSENEKIKYMREVPLETVVNFDNFSLKVHGRADGIFFDGENYFLHEIKSTYIESSVIDKPLKASHKAQMMIYAYIYALKNNLNEIRGRLSYFCLSNDTIVDIEYKFEFTSLKSVVEQMIDEYAAFLARRIKSIETFILSASNLSFPFKSYRKGQRESAIKVYSAIIKNENLFLQAPTGSGKTMMTLFPAVKAAAEGDISKIFCLSAKNQTIEVTHSALKLLRENGLKVKSCVITAKSKCCKMQVQDCNPDICPYSEGFYEKLHNAINDILENDDFSCELIDELSEKYQICPYELSLEVAQECSIIICDYNYLFDPTVYLKRFFDFHDNYVFLIDEAHNLPDRGRDMYSAAISKEKLLKMRKLCAKESAVYKRLTKLSSLLNTLFKLDSITLNKDDIKKLSYQISAVNDAAERESAPNEVILFIKELLRFNIIFEKVNDNFIIYHEKNSLYISCINSAPFLQESIQKGISAVLYSATLSPFDFFKNSILPDTKCFGHTAPYPFNTENLKVYSDYSVDTRFKNRENVYPIIAEKLKKIRKNFSGNIVVYFPSYVFLEKVAENYGDCVIQKSSFTKKERDSFLNNFKNDNVTAFAVMGSHFSEGIGIENLAGIVIVGVCLPQVSFLRNKMREYFQEKYGKGFEYAYIYPGINKVCQASGRLIRDENDSGFLVLIDNRFNNYKNLLPSYWTINEITDGY